MGLQEALVDVGAALAVAKVAGIAGTRKGSLGVAARGIAVASGQARDRSALVDVDTGTVNESKSNRARADVGASSIGAVGVGTASGDTTQALIDILAEDTAPRIPAIAGTSEGACGV